MCIGRVEMSGFSIETMIRVFLSLACVGSGCWRRLVDNDIEENLSPQHTFSHLLQVTNIDRYMRRSILPT